MAGPGAVAKARNSQLVFAALMLTMIMASLDQSAVNTALPRMTSDLGGLAHLSWVVTAFMLGSTVSTPIYGKLSDMYGRRRLLGISIAIFLIASLLCGTADTMAALIIWRGVQGLGAGGLMTLSQTVVGDLVPPSERGRYQGLFTGAFAVSSVAGPLFGGILTTSLSWRWIFYVNLPVGALALALIFYALEPSKSGRDHSIDYAGTLLLAAATVCTLLLLTWGGSTVPWWSGTMLAMVAAAVVLFVLFVRRERVAAEPVIDLALFHRRSFAIGVSASGMMAFAMLGSLVFLPLLFQVVLGLNPAEAGLMMLPQVGAMLVSSVAGGRWSSRLGRPKPFLVLGVACEASALAALAALTAAGSGYGLFLAALALLGFGMGVGMPNATVIVQNAVGGTALGTATATMTFVRSLGGAFGVALSGGVVAAQLSGRLAVFFDSTTVAALGASGVNALSALSPQAHAATLDAYRGAIAATFTTGALVMACAVVVCLALPNEKLARRRGDEPATSTPEAI